MTAPLKAELDCCTAFAAVIRSAARAVMDCFRLVFVLSVLGAMVTRPASAAAAGGATAQAPIEDHLVVQTPISPFIVDAALKEFARYAREKWNLNVRTTAWH